MNFDVNSLEWQEVEDLTDDKTYTLQAKAVNDYVFYKNYVATNILLAQSADAPEDNKTGFLDSQFKFKKTSGVKVFIKPLGTPINVEVQEVL